MYLLQNSHMKSCKDEILFYIKRGSSVCSDLLLASEMKTEFKCSVSQRRMLKALVHVNRPHEIKTRSGWKMQLSDRCEWDESRGPVRLQSYISNAQRSVGLCMFELNCRWGRRHKDTVIKKWETEAVSLQAVAGWTSSTLGRKSIRVGVWLYALGA